MIIRTVALIVRTVALALVVWVGATALATIAIAVLFGTGEAAMFAVGLVTIPMPIIALVWTVRTIARGLEVDRVREVMDANTREWGGRNITRR